MPNMVIETLQKQLAGTTDDQFVDRLFDFMRDHGQSRYDPSVTQLEHGLQSAALANARDSGARAVTAALFHDIGHLLVDEHNQRNDFLEEDLNHEEIGATFLAPYFPPEVTEPIRLHVPAKRYLCTVDPTYYNGLSEGSKRSFEVQGGRMADEERTLLEENLYLQQALDLRRFDDQAKVANRETPPIFAYGDMVRKSLRPDRPRRRLEVESRGSVSL